jgi:hypothetical protein
MQSFLKQMYVKYWNFINKQDDGLSCILNNTYFLLECIYIKKSICKQYDELDEQVVCS